MMGIWQASLAGVAAVGLHVAGFALVPVGGGAQASGDGGNATITLATSDPGVTAMVATWDAPPAVADAPAALVLMEAAPAMPLPTVDAAPTLPDAMPMPQRMMAEAVPIVGEAPAPLPTTRPKARPVQAAQADPPTAPAPTAKPKPAGAGTAGQVAAGSGGGTQAGSGGKASAGTLSGAAQAELKAEWGGKHPRADRTQETLSGGHNRHGCRQVAPDSGRRRAIAGPVGLAIIGRSGAGYGGGQGRAIGRAVCQSAERCARRRKLYPDHQF
jgi:periplasmic protein TonB